MLQFLNLYGICISAGIIIAFISLYIFENVNILKNEDYINVITYIYFFAIIGARVWHIILYDSNQAWWKFYEPGYSLFGALIGIIMCSSYLIHKKILQNEIIKNISLYGLLVNCFGRIGCYCADCCEGCIQIIKIIPLQIISSIWYYFCFLILKKLYNNYKFLNYEYIIFYTLCIALERLLFDSFRYDVKFKYFYIFTQYQSYSLCFILIGIIVLLVKKFLK